jgi:hypothetical protein
MSDAPQASRTQTRFPCGYRGGYVALRRSSPVRTESRSQSHHDC